MMRSHSGAPGPQVPLASAPVEHEPAVKVPNTLRQIDSKMRLIRYLRSEGHIDDAIAAGAFAKLGSDICDMLSGGLSEHLEQIFEAERRKASTPDAEEEADKNITACHEARNEV